MFSRAEQDAIREVLAEREGLRARVMDNERRITELELREAQRHFAQADKKTAKK